MEAFLGEFGVACPWLTPVTASESLPYFDDYFALDYRVKRTPAYLELHAWNHAGEAARLYWRTEGDA